MSKRAVQRLIRSVPASDGAGVRLQRSLGQSQGARFDPFLMLDEFSSENPDDYVAGFPSHPHRGFETVTYILDGHMLHEDHLGNRGDLKSGGVQWMTAGRGIIHSEMPQQDRGRMRGFQLWINLPAREKMKPAGYRDLQPADIPEVELPGGGRVRVIAGGYAGTRGPIAGLSTEPVYLDVHLPAKTTFAHTIESGHNAFIYPYEGEVQIGTHKVPAHAAALLSSDGDAEIVSLDEPARFLLLAGKPLNEPVVQYGPFVMNTVEEIQQAVADYQSGRLTRA
jgi:quercetin 2,3-dioxygenase